ncbi:hypothetical protein NC653_000791 [Populus alba x Populus x berolinensis]|uniref:Uncharacterized protein n=1 Tax=Populus alba x Populus x berolinensis TaxID=444605 RepID=A0AAD6RJW3_9ROSI|nr:hypothetical protein NC653_000791 [Populus alba x Populus x berolinensis]
MIQGVILDVKNKKKIKLFPYLIFIFIRCS